MQIAGRFSRNAECSCSQGKQDSCPYYSSHGVCVKHPPLSSSFSRCREPMKFDWVTLDSPVLMSGILSQTPQMKVVPSQPHHVVWVNPVGPLVTWFAAECQEGPWVSGWSPFIGMPCFLHPCQLPSNSLCGSLHCPLFLHLSFLFFTFSLCRGLGRPHWARPE